MLPNHMRFPSPARDHAHHERREQHEPVGSHSGIKHRQVVERVIHEMRQRLDEPLSLNDMADIANLSPFHFNHVFSDVTGVPPRKFQAALRMQKAKQLLLTTMMSVSDICFEVGYASLGTFTTHFTRWVGVSPRHLRRVSELAEPGAVPVPHHEPPHAGRPGHSVSVNLSIRPEFTGHIFMGLFPTSLPENKPVACAVMRSSGTYHLSAVPDGQYYICAMAVDQPKDALAWLLPEEHSLFVGSCMEPVQIRGGEVKVVPQVHMRQFQMTDPPVLIALPFLLRK